MKSIKLILFLMLLVIAASAQDNLPVIKSNKPSVSIQDGKELKKDYWKLSPDAKPDVYEADVIDGKPTRVTFITDIDQLSFTVEVDKKYDFIINWDGKLCYTQIIGKRFVPRANFDKKYQTAHRGKIYVEIPEVYELVNIAIALTPTAIENKNLVYHDSEYYAKMRQWFDKYRDQPLIVALEAALKKSLYSYFNLKMNGYSFVFDKNGKIVQSKIYDRTGFLSEKSNSLRPYLPQLQSFSDASGFRKFYRKNRKSYDEQIAFYRNSANVAEMKRWLDKNFPTSNNYDSYKVIFSPLVYRSQSSTWSESKGFKELLPQVNFPFHEDVKNFFKEPLSEKSENIFRGDVVFTEINHGYINPEADKYTDRINRAISNRDRWVNKAMGASYYPGIDAFNEYMNWGLVSLRYVDYVPRNEQDRMIAFIDQMMSEGRGFPKFGDFDKFLVDLYRNRKPGQTVADLYPQIIEWFEIHNEQKP